MPVFIFAILFNLVRDTVRVARRDKRTAEPGPLCADCFYAHVQYGTNARRAISCAYTGTVRPMKLDVLYCTDYQTRKLPPRRMIGFVREIAPAK